MSEYPSELPIAEIKNVITIIKSGEATQKTAELAHDVWVIQGYAQSRIIGDPNFSLSQVTPLSATAETEEDLGVALLEKSVTQSETIEAQNLNSVLSTIDWVTIMQWSIRVLINRLMKSNII